MRDQAPSLSKGGLMSPLTLWPAFDGKGRLPTGPSFSFATAVLKAATMLERRATGGPCARC